LCCKYWFCQRNSTEPGKCKEDSLNSSCRLNFLLTELFKFLCSWNTSHTMLKIFLHKFSSLSVRYKWSNCFSKFKATLLLIHSWMLLLCLKFWQNVMPLNEVTRIFPGVYFLSGHSACIQCTTLFVGLSLEIVTLRSIALKFNKSATPKFCSKCQLHHVHKIPFLLSLWLKIFCRCIFDQSLFNTHHSLCLTGVFLENCSRRKLCFRPAKNLPYCLWSAAYVARRILPSGQMLSSCHCGQHSGLTRSIGDVWLKNSHSMCLSQLYALDGLV